MPCNRVDIEILESLQTALLVFAAHLTVALEEADIQIHSTQAALEQARHHGEQVSKECEESLNDCIAHAIYAASMGYYVRCTRYEHAWSEAERRLVQIIQCQARLEREVSQYNDAVCRLSDLLKSHLPSARAFLADYILVLKQFSNGTQQIVAHSDLTKVAKSISGTNRKRMNVVGQSNMAWKKLKTEWVHVKKFWGDNYAIIFAETFWGPIACNVTAYLSQLASLVEILEQVEHEIQLSGLCLAERDVS